MKEFEGQTKENKNSEKPDRLKLFLASNKHHWPTEASLMSFLRSGVRQGIWNKHPVKMEFIKNRREFIKNPNPRGKKEFVYGAVCNHCKGEFIQRDLEVDHIVGENKLRSLNDLQQYIENVALVKIEDLQYLCKSCHGVKTYAERFDVSIEKAKAVKKANKTMADGNDEFELVRLNAKNIPKAKLKRKEKLIELYEKEFLEGSNEK